MNCISDDDFAKLRTNGNRDDDGFSELFCSFSNSHYEIINDMNRFREADGVVYHQRDPMNLQDKQLKSRHSS
ncbi:hypothetical protein I4U23_008945 [Adineta vaga]|nr:hypothetical protein I4U23_008945 [Adineta vaga]